MGVGAVNQTQLLASLTRYIAEEIPEDEAEELLPSMPLIELGILNSLETARTMSFIEKQSGRPARLSTSKVLSSTGARTMGNQERADTGHAPTRSSGRAACIT